MSSDQTSDNSDRREFMKKACCVVLGGALGAVPSAAGVAMYMSPLRRPTGGAANRTVRVTTLDALPDDGAPHRFPVLASHVDAWTKSPDTPIGAVYLMRTKDPAQPVKALSVVCPHAGCFVEYVGQIPNYTPAAPGYFCPCHNSTFQLNGQIAGTQSPAPRGLDELECVIQNEKEIWVKFQNFETGTSEKRPIGA